MSKIQCKLSMRTLTALPTLFKSPGLHPTNCLTHSAYLAILQHFGEYSSFVHHLDNFVTSLLSGLTLLKNWSIRSARISSYGCTYEVWRVSARVARGASLYVSRHNLSITGRRSIYFGPLLFADFCQLKCVIDYPVEKRGCLFTQKCDQILHYHLGNKNYKDYV